MNGMSRQEDGPRSVADTESTPEYQDDEFRDEVGLSDPLHPLFPTSPESNNAVTHKNCGQPELADWRTQQDK